MVVKIWQRLRLDVKVIGSTLILLGIFAVLLGWSAIAAEQRALQAQIQSQGSSLAEAAAIFSIEPLLTLDDGLLSGYVNRLTRTHPDIGFVRILDVTGRVVTQAPDILALPVAEPESVRLFRVNILVEPGDTEPIGVVEVGLLTHNVDLSAASRVRWLLSASLGVFVILSMLLSLLLKKMVTDPVRQLDRFAKSLGQGNMESPIVLPGTDEMGRLAAAMDAMRRDIRESHAAIRRQEEYVASLIDSALDMILSVDQERRIVVFNPAAVKTFGYTQEEVWGKPVNLLFADPQEADRVLDIIHESGNFVGEINGRRKDGALFPVFISASLLKDRKGRVIGALGNLRDLSEQKQVVELERARKTAEAANQAKSAFLAVMSHEIRSPMNGVIGMADLLASTTLSAEQRQYVEIILRSSHSLLALLNGILDFSKAEAGALKLENTFFNPHEVVIMACEIMMANAHGKGLGLFHEIDASVPACVQGDPLRLRQILVNLVGNAIKFTAVGEVRVTVSMANCEQNAEYPVTLHFAVTDTGVGVSPDKQEIIFDRFSQADFSTTRKFGGVGLGLTISKQLVELMQGRIWLESSGVDQGSSFQFLARFKACRATDTVVAVPESPLLIKSVAKTRALHILVVDDGLDNRILAAHILRKEGHTVVLAENGVAALDALRKEPFDMVLMDVQMPEMDGIVATRIIREGGLGMRVARIPIMAISAGALQEEKDRGLAAGMDEFLTKPYRARTLLDAVRRLAQTARRSPFGLHESNAQIPFVVTEHKNALDRLARAMATQDPQEVIVAANGLREVVTSKEVRSLAMRITLAAQRDHLERARKYYERLQHRFEKAESQETS
ncbi:MAG: response regulator [Magnetococcales bacterium]|nr:response regulator [Magnetococcales bacterium]MBF0440124.1 response regulator [Magnetococcales bacterium]